MPYVKKGARRIPLPSDPDYWVELRAHVRYGDRREANEASTTRYIVPLAEVPPEDLVHIVDRTEDGKCLVIRQAISAYNGVLASRLICAWNLTDEDDQPLPITPESVDLLVDRDWEMVWGEVEKRTGRGEGDEAPFDSGSGEPSTETIPATQTSEASSSANSSPSSGTAAPPS